MENQNTGCSRCNRMFGDKYCERALNTENPMICEECMEKELLEQEL